MGRNMRQTQKEEIIIYFEVLFWYLTSKSEENHEILSQHSWRVVEMVPLRGLARATNY
jgi:hypothetical protein